MCLPFSQEGGGLIGGGNNFSPERQKRYEEHLSTQRQKLKDSGFDFNSNKANHPAWGLINAADKLNFIKKDDAENSAALALNTGETTNQGPSNKSLKISDKPVVKTKNKKSNLNKSGGSGALRISTNTINT